ncbi:glycosyltransferase [Helicobacter sp. 23-1045]
MRVLQLGKFFPPDIGGIETIMSDITISLNNRKITCDVLCSNSKPKYSEQILHCGAKIMRCASFGKIASTAIAPQMIFKLRKIIANYDIIHLHLPDPMANLALFLANHKGKKVIIHWHSDIVRQKILLKLYAPLQNALLKRADKIIATSPKYIEYSPLLQRFSHKVVAIPIGTHSSFRSDIYDAKASFEKKSIFALGRMVHYKGFEYLIEAMKFLPEFHLFIAGGGDKKESLEGLIKELDLERQITLLGEIDNRCRIYHYNTNSIFVLPSINRSEAFGVVQIEAMSCKMPVISTNIKGSGVPWVNKDGESGVVVPLGDGRAIADAVLRIMSDYKKFSEGAQRRYLQCFTLEKMIDEIIALYKKVGGER